MARLASRAGVSRPSPAGGGILSRGAPSRDELTMSAVACASLTTAPVATPTRVRAPPRPTNPAPPLARARHDPEPHRHRRPIPRGTGRDRRVIPAPRGPSPTRARAPPEPESLTRSTRTPSRAPSPRRLPAPPLAAAPPWWSARASPAWMASRTSPATPSSCSTVTPKSRDASSPDRVSREAHAYPPRVHSSSLTSGARPGEYVFKQEWETKQAYEDYMNHPQRRRSHMAPGVYQYMPKDKWSVPENSPRSCPSPSETVGRRGDRKAGGVGVDRRGDDRSGVGADDARLGRTRMDETSASAVRRGRGRTLASRRVIR